MKLKLCLPRTVILTAILTFCFSSAFSGTRHLYELSIVDSSGIPAVSKSDNHVNLTFGSNALNAAIQSATIYTFEQGYANARSPMLTVLYLLETDDSTLPARLQRAAPNSIVDFQEARKISLLSLPNDYSVHNTLSTTGIVQWTERQKELDFLKVDSAWMITEGDSSMIIGITDSRFETTHPELGGNSYGPSKFARIRDSVWHYAYDSSSSRHGTKIAGTLAAKTNNNLGFSSIGNKCRLDISTKLSDYGSTPDMYQMSVDGVKVFNGSWTYYGFMGCQPRLDEDMKYNEMYENGMSLCFGAGNRPDYCFAGPKQFYYPASYDNVLSTGGVGHLTPVGQVFNQPGHYYNGQQFSLIDVHERVLNDSSDIYWSSAHNNRVDICAPDYGVNSILPTWFDTVMSYGHFSRNNEYGTSFSSPYTAGTVALILCAKPTLSPYQREYIIKKTARNIYNVATNYKYTGLLGAGSLNTNAAVRMAKAYNVNDPATQTMYIEGFDINTKCAPGHNSIPGMLPQITARVANSNGHVRYAWSFILTGANPTTVQAMDTDKQTLTVLISSPAPKRTLHMWLTVTDSSDVPKVAKKEMLLFLDTVNTHYELAMRDSYLDVMVEPNNQTTLNAHDFDIWHSPDIWNRKLEDNIRTHENPEYFATDSPNHMYVRVKNVGCAPSPANQPLKIYWTKASTGEKWPVDWTTRTVTVGGVQVPAGGEITYGNPVLIPALNPGDTFVTSRPWHPVKPQRYDPALSSVDVCGLARITELKADSGITFTEDTLTSKNVRQNNNIVTRNMTTVNLGHKPGFGNLAELHQIDFANTSQGDRIFTLQVIRDRDINQHFTGDASQNAFIKVYLGDLYDRWVSGGRKGNVKVSNDKEKSIIYNIDGALNLDNISLRSNESFPINLEFTLLDAQVETAVSQFPIFVRQLTHDARGTEEVYGDVDFVLNITEDGNGLKKKAPIAENTYYTSQFGIMPNPAGEFVNVVYWGEKPTMGILSLTDVTGKTLMRTNDVLFEKMKISKINLAQYPAGLYYLRILNHQGKVESFKVLHVR